MVACGAGSMPNRTFRLCRPQLSRERRRSRRSCSCRSGCRFESEVFDGARLIGDDGGGKWLDGMDLLAGEGPARLESSGTWLRAGFLVC